MRSEIPCPCMGGQPFCFWFSGRSLGLLSRLSQEAASAVRAVRGSRLDPLTCDGGAPPAVCAVSQLRPGLLSRRWARSWGSGRSGGMAGAGGVTVGGVPGPRRSPLRVSSPAGCFPALGLWQSDPVRSNSWGSECTFNVLQFGGEKWKSILY